MGDSWGFQQAGVGMEEHVCACLCACAGTLMSYMTIRMLFCFPSLRLVFISSGEGVEHEEEWKEREFLRLREEKIRKTSKSIETE